ncbi:chitosanase [Kitasatospora cheerisanensis KCTC 2395]|uniref:Chitosanase n=1 Tax=Kitasatospora cheerisanensis KCTC 2395 TaxID=1348663 RepID=A0A066YSB8_9ACTN|nr:chitosanase [Kitasatospora cheerisanensis KCTC 2395]
MALAVGVAAAVTTGIAVAAPQGEAAAARRPGVTAPPPISAAAPDSPTETVTSPEPPTAAAIRLAAAQVGAEPARLAAATPTPSPTPTPTATTAPRPELTDAKWKEYAQQLVSSAENSTLDWRSQYPYIEDIGDGHGYTAGIVGFCSGTGDLADVITRYTALKPNNILAKYLPALALLDGSASHLGLDPTFVGDWQLAAKDPLLQQAQNEERDRQYFTPAVQQAKTDGLHALGQFVYYDAIVVQGPVGFATIRTTALAKAKTPAKGGDETAYLNAFLDARKAYMLNGHPNRNTSRIDTEQRVFLQAGNLDLRPPLVWQVYGDTYTITA